MPATTTKRKRGRPRKPDSEKRRNNVTIRMRDSLKRRLKEAAVDAGRSLSEEIEFRLEKIFVERVVFGGDMGYEGACLLFATIKMYEDTSGKSWRDDPDGNVLVRAIADDFFRRWGPGGLKAFQPISQDHFHDLFKSGTSGTVYVGDLDIPPPTDKDLEEAYKLFKPGVTEHLLDSDIAPPTDKDKERAHAKWGSRK